MPPTPADMIFLVDGSWSIGHSHFQQVKDFLASIIEPFEIGPDKVQVGGFRPHALRPHLVVFTVSPWVPCRREVGQGREETLLLTGVACSTRPGGVPSCTDGTAGSWGDILVNPVWKARALQACAPPSDPGQPGCVRPASAQHSSSHARTRLFRPDSVQWRPPDRVGPEYLQHQGGGAGSRAQPPLQRGKHIHRSAPAVPPRMLPCAEPPSTPLPDLQICA